MIKKSIVSTVGFLLAFTFLLLGLMTKPPQKEIDYYSSGRNGYTEYVGGDAYNYIIEASLRGGAISGASAAKAIYLSAAGLIFILSLSLLASDNREKSAEEDDEE